MLAQIRLIIVELLPAITMPVVIQPFKPAVRGQVKRKNVSIILVGTDGSKEVTRWNLTNAWVSEWRGAKLDAMGQEAAIERVTIVPETLEHAPDVKQPEEGAVA